MGSPGRMEDKITGGAIKELRPQELETSSEKILKSPRIITGVTVSKLSKYLRNNEEGPRDLWMIAPKSCTEKKTNLQVTRMTSF